MLGGVHGDNEAQVYRDLCRAVEEWMRIQSDDGDPFPEATAGKTYSGRFVIRVGPELHRHLTVEALRAGESLNSYCVRMLRRRIRRKARENKRLQRTAPASKR
jgi:predicted HicB family RNase H-like nuclease